MCARELVVLKELLFMAGMRKKMLLDDGKLSCKFGQVGMKVLLAQNDGDSFFWLRASQNATVVKPLQGLWVDFRNWCEACEVVNQDPAKLRRLGWLLLFRIRLIFGPMFFKCESAVQILLQGHVYLGMVNEQSEASLLWPARGRTWKH
jgi:hypothetical protein